MSQTDDKPRKRHGFIGRTLSSLIRKTERALFAEETARRSGFLQSVDPRVKIIGLLSLIVTATLARNFFSIFFVFWIAIVLAAASKIGLSTIAKRAWLPALIFTGTIALPVLFITPGDALFRLPVLGWAVSVQGLHAAIYLISRVETTVTLSLLLIATTPWANVLKALRILKVPVVFVMILGMTYRYIFVMLESALNMFEARQSRMIGRLSGSDSRRLATASMGVLLTKSFYLNGELYLAMRSRGFRGEAYTLDEFKMRPKDWLALALFAVLAGLALWMGQRSSLAEWLTFRW